MISPVAIVFLVFFYLRLRGTRLAALSLPLTISLGEAGFINAYSLSFRITYFLRITFPDVAMLFLVLAYLHTRKSWKYKFFIPKNGVVSFFKAFVVMIILFIPLTWIHDMQLDPNVILTPRHYLYFPLSVFLWVSIIRRCTVEDLNRLMSVLFEITLIGAVLYSLSSVGLPVFPYTGWESGKGFGTVTRDFSTFPPYMPFALGYVLFSEKKVINRYRLVFMLIFLISILLSYTRSWIFASVSSVYFALILKKEKSSKEVSLLILLPLIFITSFTLIEYFAPQNADYLQNRFSDVGTSGLPSNADLRLTGVKEVFNYIRTLSPINGVGFSRNKPNYERMLGVNLKRLKFGDILWVSLIFDLGLLGASSMLFIILYSVFISVKILKYRKYVHMPRYIKLITVFTVWTAIRTTASGEFFWYPVIYGLAFAFLILAYKYPECVPIPNKKQDTR